VIGLRSPDGMVAARLSGMAQGVGYGIAALGPLAVGMLYGRGHGWWLVGGWSLLLALAAALCGLGAGRARSIGAYHSAPLALSL
jgi:CP family cyanate transporter-like MFS transporter